MSKSKTKGKKRRQERAKQRLEAENVGASMNMETPRRSGPAILNASLAAQLKPQDVVAAELLEHTTYCGDGNGVGAHRDAPTGGSRTAPTGAVELKRIIRPNIPEGDALRPLSPMAIEIANRWAADAVEQFERIRRL